MWLSAWGNASVAPKGNEGWRSKEEWKKKKRGGESGIREGLEWRRNWWAKASACFSSQAIYFYHLARTKDVIGSVVLGQISFMRGTKPWKKGWFTAKILQKNRECHRATQKQDRQEKAVDKQKERLGYVTSCLASATKDHACLIQFQSETIKTSHRHKRRNSLRC